MISNLIFDLGHVLTGLDKDRSVAAFGKIGCTTVAAYVEEHRTEDLFLNIELGLISTEDFCREVRRICGSNTPDSDIVWAWNELLTGIPAEKLDALLRLRQNHRLFLLSNTNFMHWNKCCEEFFAQQGHSVSDFFELTFLSCAMHKAKPDPAIFSEALCSAGIRADETLFIDDLEENCKAAESLGISAFHEKSGHDWLGADGIWKLL